jgi:hypothetical protein
MSPVSLFVFGVLYTLILTQLIVAALVFFFGYGGGDYPRHWVTAAYIAAAALAEGALVFVAQATWFAFQSLLRNARRPQP